MSQRITAIKYHCPNDSRCSKQHQVAASKLVYEVHSGDGVIHLIKVKFVCPHCSQIHEKILKGAI